MRDKLESFAHFPYIMASALASSAFGCATRSVLIGVAVFGTFNAAIWLVRYADALRRSR